MQEPEGFAEVPALLTKHGFSVVSPQGLDEASRLVSQRSDLGIVLSDFIWKDMRGTDIYHHLHKELAPSRSLYLIFLAEAASINDVVAALRLQAVDFLHKPSNPRVLIEAVRRADRLLSRRDAERVMTRRVVELFELTRTMMDLLPPESNPADPASVGAEPPSTYGEITALAADSEDAIALGRSRRNLRKVVSAMKIQKLQRRFFGDDVIANPCWDMLLDLYEKKMLGPAVCVTSLCIASGLPPTTALRRIDILEAEGLVRRIEDSSDRRRVLIELTPTGAEKLVEYFENVE